MEPRGIEPLSTACKAAVLPLYRWPRTRCLHFTWHYKTTRLFSAPRLTSERYDMARPKPRIFCVAVCISKLKLVAVARVEHGLQPYESCVQPSHFPAVRYKEHSYYLPINITEFSQMSSPCLFFYPPTAYFLYSSSENWRMPLRALELTC